MRNEQTPRIPIVNSQRSSRRWYPWVPWYLLIVIIGTGYPFYFAVPDYITERFADVPAWQDERGLSFDGSGMASLPGKVPSFAREIHAAQAYWLALEVTPAGEPPRMRSIFSYGSWLDEQCLLIAQEGRDLILQLGVNGQRSGNRLVIPEALRGQEPARLAVSVDANSLRVFRDRTLIHEAELRQTPIPHWCERCYVAFGNDVSGQTAWRGTIQSFALGAGPLPVVEDGSDAPSALLRIDGASGALPEALRFHLSNVWLRESDIPWRLMPFSQARFQRRPWRDWIINTLLFIPLGYGARRAGWHTVQIAVGACLCSLAIELVQVFLPHRQTDATDIVFNSLGAILGGFFAMRRSAEHRTAEPDVLASDA